MDIRLIPKTKDKYNEFKEFYQYDTGIEKLSYVGTSERRTAVKRIMNSVRVRFAIAVCAFGNNSSGGFVHLGIRAGGTVAGLVRDRKIGNFVDYEDLFANHIHDTLETFLQDRVFILRNIQVVFRRIGGKTICTVQVLPADKPLYVHVDKEQRFYVRGPTPRAERLAGHEEQFRYIKSRFPQLWMKWDWSDSTAVHCSSIFKSTFLMLHHVRRCSCLFHIYRQKCVHPMLYSPLEQPKPTIWL